jgi:hypothetical protein
MCGKAPLFRQPKKVFFAATPLMPLGKGIRERRHSRHNPRSTNRKSGAFPHIGGQSPQVIPIQSQPTRFEWRFSILPETIA